ncbi:MAG TPA: PEP-CTERM sorting domain-containing protein [Gemmatimonas aurantiaca]|uniref:PEP-CTERM sorting domain-containing protein n=1 Tax=Gemmatimonas aurantiaca TaxID=173480 RepID=A0A3D4VE71_9BACT|nr:PEP-CTERM sorting domain-containing protein [Gemmatimonas aurantiaca]
MHALPRHQHQLRRCRWHTALGDVCSDGSVIDPPPTTVPEPSTFVLLGIGTVALMTWSRRRHA